MLILGNAIKDPTRQKPGPFKALPPIGEVREQAARLPEARLKPGKTAEATATAKPEKAKAGSVSGERETEPFESIRQYICFSKGRHLMTRGERIVNIAANLAWAAVAVPVFAAGGMVAGLAAGVPFGLEVAATTLWVGAAAGAAAYILLGEAARKLAELATNPKLRHGGSDDQFTINPAPWRKKSAGEET